MEAPDVLAAVREEHPQFADDAPGRQTVGQITAKVTDCVTRQVAVWAD
jgi:hypothetical protein